MLRVASAGGERIGHALLAAVTGLDDAALARALRPGGGGQRAADRRGRLRVPARADPRGGPRGSAARGARPLHSRFAQAINADPALVPPGRAAVEQAHHWYAAHDAARALVSAWQAAAEAGRALAYAEQLAMLSRVLELWEQVPDAARADRRRSRGRARSGGPGRRAGRRVSTAGSRWPRPRCGRSTSPPNRSGPRSCSRPAAT